MPALVFFLISLLFLPGALGSAQAQSTTELRQQRGLFVFEDFRHWVSLQYDYSGHESNRNSSSSASSSHGFKESYNASLNTAILNPHFLETSLQVGLLFDQNRNRTGTSSSSGSGTLYLYNFSATGLDRSPTPYYLLSYRNVNTIQTPFAPAYTSDSTGNEFDFSLLNTLIKSRFHYARNTQKNSGGGNDNDSVTNTYSYDAEHRYKDVSSTSLHLGFSDQTGRSSTGPDSRINATFLDFSNNYYMGAQRNYSLTTSFNLNNTFIDDLPQKGLSLSESFQAVFGPALSLNANYVLTNTRSENLTDQPQESTRNQGEVTLKHKLFKSLETVLSGRVSSDKAIDGNEDRYAAVGNIRYTKLLPEASRLIVGVKKEYELVDRRFGSSTSTVTDELHTGVHQGDAINLPLANGTLLGVISVKSRSPLFTYVEGVDFTVNLPLKRIDILAGIGVRIDMDGTGSDLYITYVEFKDPQIKYANNSLSLSTELGLLKNEYQLGATYIDAQVTLIKGPANNSLHGNRSMTLYAGGSHDNVNYRLSYRKTESGSLAYQSIEGFGKATWETSYSSLSLMATEQYNKYDATPTSAGYGENSAQMTVSYVRNILTNSRLTMQSHVIDLRSDLRGNSDSLSFEAAYLIIMNKIVINLSLQTAWAFQNSGTSRDDSAHINFSRYF